MDEQVILGNFVDELYYKQCNHEGSDINKSPLLMSKSTSNMYHEGYDKPVGFFLHNDADFNPRTHEGYDERFGWILGGDMISIHVPTKGTTAKIYNNIPAFLLIFIYFPIFSYQNIRSTLFKNNYWYFFQCESLCIFLSASYSHFQNTQVQHLSAFLYELWQTFQLLH